MIEAKHPTESAVHGFLSVPDCQCPGARGKSASWQAPKLCQRLSESHGLTRVSPSPS